MREGPPDEDMLELGELLVLLLLSRGQILRGRVKVPENLQRERGRESNCQNRVVLWLGVVAAGREGHTATISRPFTPLPYHAHSHM